MPTDSPIAGAPAPAVKSTHVPFAAPPHAVEGSCRWHGPSVGNLTSSLTLNVEVDVVVLVGVLVVVEVDVEVVLVVVVLVNVEVVLLVVVDVSVVDVVVEVAVVVVRSTQIVSAWDVFT